MLAFNLPALPGNGVCCRLRSDVDDDIVLLAVPYLDRGLDEFSPNFTRSDFSLPSEETPNEKNVYCRTTTDGYLDNSSPAHKCRVRGFSTDD